MVVAEVAMAIMLLVGAGLLIRSAMAVNRVDLGFDPANILVGRIALPEVRYSGHQRLSAVFRQIESEARSLPGVQNAALANRSPLSGGFSNGLVPEGKPTTLDYAIQSAARFVSPGYFETVRIPFRKGRNFNAGDVKGGLPVMIINETLARQAFGDEDPIGKRIGCCEELTDPKNLYKTVIGVVGDVRAYGITSTPPPEFYLPIEQMPADGWRWMAQSMEIMVRTSGDPHQHADDLRAILKRIDPLVPIYLLGPLEERIANTLEQRRFSTLLLSSFAALALFLAAIGIYGVLSYTVSQRTQEIGIRMALGGKPSQVLGLILGYGLRLAVIGAVIGVGAAFALSRLLTSLLFGVTPGDVATYALATAVLIAMALLASYLPASRAMRIDPMVALRYE
jgi:putative ABC transport system permease protein